jgi:hypothetical protein
MKVILIAMTLCVACIGSAHAGSHGAFATNPDGAIGWSADYDTAKLANEAAVSSCNKQIGGGKPSWHVTSFQDTCAALADTRDADGVYTFATNRLLEKAMNEAVASCDATAGAGKCAISLWACTGTESGKH